METNKGNFPVFVYGILKDRFEGKAVKIKAITYDLGDFPAITKIGQGNDLEGKLIYVDADTLNEFDYIEGVPTLYKRELVRINDIFAFVYVFVNKDSIKDYPRVIGSWKRA